MTKAPFPTVSFLDLDFYRVSMSQTLNWMEECIQNRRPRFLCTLNAALLVWSRKDPFLKETYKNADLAVADSTVVYYALKLMGTPVPEPLEAWQIMHQFIKKNYSKGYRFFFLGSKPEVVEQAVVNLKKSYPGIQIVGYQHGYFQGEEEKVARKILESKTDCLFVGMSSPLKEKFIKKYQPLMQVPVSLGVGGGIDILAGQYRQAPGWMHKMGLAWFFRLLLEPRRMWRRYLTTNTLFLCLFFKAFFKKNRLF
ncbi:MAG: WecB/TagA/CpsF family glycosyltransferase [Deltaproteobacteria bacterium]|nr:WecB/TagA/CpsF family glycosyltransferase [Deltaproteobacteria bacterium]